MGTLGTDNGADPGGYAYRDQESLKVLLYSSHPLVIKGIKGMLADVPGIDPVGHAANRIEAMLRIHELEPSLVIVNDDGIGNGSSNILESISPLISEFPRLSCLLIMSTHDPEKELAALKLGIKGVMIENSERDTLLECIRCISGGGLWFRRAVLEKFISEQLFFHKLKESAKQELIPPTFTRRELEIIQMAGKGVKNREIGRSLFISEKTVKHHLSKIFKKLQIKKRTELRMYL